MADPINRPVLSLLTSATVTRPRVAIDHVEYEIRTHDDLTLVEHAFIERIGPRVMVLSERLRTGALTEVDEATELDQLLGQVSRVALVAPEDVQDRIRSINRLLISDVFLERLTIRLRPTSATMIPEANPLPGANSFPVSSASTARPRKRGPTSSRTGRSKRTSR